MLKHLILAVSLASPLPVFAQEATDHSGHAMMGDMGPASMAFMEANTKMHEMMAIEYTGNAAVLDAEGHDDAARQPGVQVFGELLLAPGRVVHGRCGGQRHRSPRRSRPA